MKDEFDRLNSQTRNDIIAKIDTYYNNKVFFKSIKRMTGNLTNASPNIIHNDQKIMPFS